MLSLFTFQSPYPLKHCYKAFQGLLLFARRKQLNYNIISPHFCQHLILKKLFPQVCVVLFLRLIGDGLASIASHSGIFQPS